MNSFDPQKLRQHFPLLSNHRPNLAEFDLDKRVLNDATPLIYFDNAATTQKPNAVIDCQQSYYQASNANVHRASHMLSAKATSAFEQARTTVKAFINAKSEKEIIWTKGATEAINLVARSLGEQLLTLNDEIIICVSEHHANIVPWQLVAEKTGAVIKVAKLTENGVVDLADFEQLLTEKTKIVCCAHISNIIGKSNPIEHIIAKAKNVGAVSIIDGAQAVAHLRVDVQALDCDFYVFSAHKMYGPTGVGVLYGKQALLEKMPPYQGGGEMIKTVSFKEKTQFNHLPFKFEAGTPNIAGIIAFSPAIKFMQQLQQNNLAHYEQLLTEHCYYALAKIPQINFVVSGIPEIPVLSFIVEGLHNHDIASALDSFGIAVRSGHHCAMPLMESLTLSGCIRVSMAPYNTLAEIDYFIACLKNIIAGSDSVGASHLDASSLEKVAIEDNSIAEKCLTSTDIIHQFSSISGWHNRHREIMLLSKQLFRLDKQQRNEQSLIQGCESLAWLLATKDNQQKFYFQADSDAKIIRGLLVIVLAAFNGKTAKQILHFDINGYFATLGLMQQLSPSRGNGVVAIVEKIKKLVMS